MTRRDRFDAFFSFLKVPLLLYASWRFGDSCTGFFFFSDESFVFLAYKWMFACIYINIYIVRGSEEILRVEIREFIVDEVL